MYHKIIKPLVERILALVLLVIAMPVMILITVVLAITNPDETVFFKQKRLGFKNKHFTMIKFRTLMKESSDKNIGHLPEEITKAGLFLRKYKLDELPQLWQVICGRMSLIGPRPLPVEYEFIIERKFSGRKEVLPGITGLVQVKGGNRLSWEERLTLDKQYINSIGFCVDLKIVIKTFRTMFFPFEEEISQSLI